MCSLDFDQTLTFRFLHDIFVLNIGGGSVVGPIVVVAGAEEGEFDSDKMSIG